MFRSDRGDTEELYRSFLPGIKNFTTIDERSEVRRVGKEGRCW